MRPFQFLAGPWENSVLPTIVKDSPSGGDPHILATLKKVHNPDALHELCMLANNAIELSSFVSQTALPPRKCIDCDDRAQPCYMNCGPDAVSE